MTVLGWDFAAGRIQELALDAVGEWIKGSEGSLWIDLEAADVQRIADLGPVLGLHPLTLEDTLEQEHFSHPKVDDYEDYLFIVLHSVRWDEQAKAIKT